MAVGGGFCSAYYGINRGEGASEGAMGVEMTGKDETLPGGGGGGGMMGQTPWRHPRGGGYDGTNTLAASLGGGGWDKHPGATPLPHPDKECESCRGKGGEGYKGTTIKGKQVGGIAKRYEQR